MYKLQEVHCPITLALHWLSISHRAISSNPVVFVTNLNVSASFVQARRYSCYAGCLVVVVKKTAMQQIHYGLELKRKMYVEKRRKVFSEQRQRCFIIQLPSHSKWLIKKSRRFSNCRSLIKVSFLLTKTFFTFVVEIGCALWAPCKLGKQWLHEMRLWMPGTKRHVLSCQISQMISILGPRSISCWLWTQHRIFLVHLENMCHAGEG